MLELLNPSPGPSLFQFESKSNSQSS